MTTTADEDVAPRWGWVDATGAWVVAQIVGVFGGLAIIVASGRTDDAAKLERLPLGLFALLNVPLWLGMVGAAVGLAIWKGHGPVRDFGLRVHWIDVPIGIGVGLAAEFLLVPLISW